MFSRDGYGDKMDPSFVSAQAKPRLQIFVSDLSATGVVRNAIAIANRAAFSGYNVRLLTCQPDGVLRKELDERVTLVALLSTGQDENRKFQLKRALPAYRRHSRDWDADILLSAGNHGHLLSAFAWLGLRGQKVMRISNDPGHFRAKSGLFERIWRAAKFKLLTHFADRLVVVSPAIAASPPIAPHVASGKALLIQNGVDLEVIARQAGEYCPHPWLAEPTTVTILAVGRPVKQKNFPILLRAFAIARRSRDLRLVILGAGRGHNAADLAKLADELGIREHVDFLPPVSNPFSYMARADALVLPSFWEGTSNVLLEAMACQTPVIAATSAGDASSVLGQGRYGLLVDPLDVDELAAALLRQLSEKRVLPGSRASQFDRGNALAAYMQLFNQLLGAPNSHLQVRRAASDWPDRRQVA